MTRVENLGLTKNEENNFFNILYNKLHKTGGDTYFVKNGKIVYGSFHEIGTGNENQKFYYDVTTGEQLKDFEPPKNFFKPRKKNFWKKLDDFFTVG